MPPQDAPYLDYHVSWRSGASRPGRHGSRQGGGGGNFREYRPFWQVPDARQIDIKRSALDPFGELIVRQNEQRSSINVILAIDLSRSMQPVPERSGLRCIARLAEAAARAALRAGDGFGVVGFDRVLRDDVWLPPTRSRAAARQMVSHLAGQSSEQQKGAREWSPMIDGGKDGSSSTSLHANAVSSKAIVDLSTRLPGRRCLVLLASDFLMPIDLIERALTALARHDVAPIVLEIDNVGALPAAGLLRLADAENGRTRLVLMRPALRRRWQNAAAARRRQLDLLFARFGRPAFHASGGLDVEALSNHLVMA